MYGWVPVTDTGLNNSELTRASRVGRPLFLCARSGRVGERLQKYLIVLGLFEVYHVRTAEKALESVVQHRYKLIFLA